MFTQKTISRTLLLALLVGCFTWSCTTQRVSTYTAAEKINVGYGDQDQRSFTGSASVISNPELNQDLVTHLKKVPGIMISGSGSNATISIRGSQFSSFSDDHDPLFVINGNPVDGGFSSVYQMVDVNDIKRITVLKDGSSTSIYGTRGANGVILIDFKVK